MLFLLGFLPAAIIAATPNPTLVGPPSSTPGPTFPGPPSGTPGPTFPGPPQGQYFGVISNGFHPNWPVEDTSFVSPFAIPFDDQGGMGFGTKNGAAYVQNLAYLNGYNQDHDPNTLVVLPVALNFTGTINPKFLSGALSYDKKNLVVGTESDGIWHMEDVDLIGGQTKFELRTKLFDVSERIAMNAFLGSRFTLSEFCDLDGDGLEDEILIGGATGKLLAGKFTYDWTLMQGYALLFPTNDQRLKINDGPFLGTFSNPSCARDPFDTSFTLIAAGYASGEVRVWRYNKYFPGNAWVPVQHIQPENYLYNVVGQGFAAPTFIDMNNDFMVDAMVVGFKNGSLSVMFHEYSGGGTTTPDPGTCGEMSCGPGNLQTDPGCLCNPCPAGTYKEADLGSCIQCGSPDYYCPEGATQRYARDPQYCTFWAPFPSFQFDQITQSPDYFNDLNYYNWNYMDAVIKFSDGVDSPITSFMTLQEVERQMFGDMRKWRNRVAYCGEPKIPDVYRDNIPGANATNGYFFVPGQLANTGVALIYFDLYNQFDTASNITFNLPSFATVFSEDGRTSLSTASLPPSDYTTFQLRIQSGSIPAGDMVEGHLYNLTMQMDTSPYWKQQVDQFASEYGAPLTLTFVMDFTDSALLLVPTSLDIDMITGDTRTENVRVFSLKTVTQYVTVNITYNGGGDAFGWLTYSLEASGSQPGTSIGSVAKCDNNSVPVPQQSDQFSRTILFHIDTTGMPSGYYSASVFVSGMPLDVQLELEAAEVDLAMTTFQWVDATNNLVNVFGSSFDWEVGVFAGMSMTLRDSLGNPSDNFGAIGGEFGVQVMSEVTYTNGTCPLTAQQCTLNIFMDKRGGGPQDVGVFVSRFNLFSKGTYKITTRVNNDVIYVNSTSSTLANPKTFQVSAKKCSDNNAAPDDLTGSNCVCKAGFGKLNSGAQAEVSCTQCLAGTFSDGISGSCSACPDGFFQDSVQMSQCKRCPDYISEPDPLGSSCSACLTDDFVRVEDGLWKCTGCGSNQRRRKVRDSNLTAIEVPHPTLPNTTVNLFFCACQPNMYWSERFSQCVSCPPGGFCVDREEKKILPRQGYWGPVYDSSGDLVFPPTLGPTTAPTNAPTNNGSAPARRQLDVLTDLILPSFIQCRREGSCPGVSISDGDLSNDELVFAALATFSANATLGNSTCTVCEEGFTGPLCFKCALSYTRYGVDQCVLCLSSTTVIGLMLMGAFFAVAICVYIISRTLATIKEDKNRGMGGDEMILLRVLMSHLQSESMVQNIDLAWPYFVLEMFAVFDLVSSTGQSAFSLDCFLNGNETSTSDCDVLTDDRARTFFLTALFVASLPILGWLVSTVYWMSRYFWIKHKTGKGRGRSFFQYNLVSIIVIVFLLYPSLSRTAFKFFSCSSETINGNRFVEADFNIVCWSSEHLAWALTLGLFMVFVYALGVPSGFYYVLKTRTRDGHRYSHVFTFLYSGFKPHKYYWEVVIMIRKLLIAACSIMLKPMGSDIQAFATAIVVFVFVCIQLHIRPYEHDRMNFIETFGLVTLYLTLFLGLFQSSASLYVGGESDNTSLINTLFGVIIVTINVAFLLFVFLQLAVSTFRVAKNSGGFGRAVLVMLGHFKDENEEDQTRKSKRNLKEGEEVKDDLDKVEDDDEDQAWPMPRFVGRLTNSAKPKVEDLYVKENRKNSTFELQGESVMATAAISEPQVEDKA